MSAAKPWKSFEEQLELLKSRGLQCDDETAALDYLERIGYYRLSGYWYPFRKMKAESTGHSYREDEFIEGSRFKDAVDLYIFDKKLRLLALDALERIELAVRVDVAYLLGGHDTFAQEKPDLFHGNFSRKKIKQGYNKGKTNHEVWLEKYNQQVRRSKREPFVQHNLKTYGKLPIWVAIEILDFGTLSRLFSGMKFNDQNTIAMKYGIEGKNLQKWLRSLNFIRNVSAHHSRLWNINILEISEPPNFLVCNTNLSGLKNYRPFLYFCFIQAMLRIICPNSHWAYRFKQLIDSFPEIAANTAILEDFGIVEGWDNWALWEFENK